MGNCRKRMQVRDPVLFVFMFHVKMKLLAYVRLWMQPGAPGYPPPLAASVVSTSPHSATATRARATTTTTTKTTTKQHLQQRLKRRSSSYGPLPKRRISAQQLPQAMTESRKNAKGTPTLGHLCLLQSTGLRHFSTIQHQNESETKRQQFSTVISALELRQALSEDSFVRSNQTNRKQAIQEGTAYHRCYAP